MHHHTYKKKTEKNRRTSLRGPSSGLKVAMRRGLHGCDIDRPSLSTTLTPSEMTLSSKLAMLSSSRLISSTYKMPLCASARRPG